MEKKYKVVIIDDESLARNIIKNCLDKFDNFEIIAECSNGFEGLKAIQELKPDLIFLDIQMPKITGFELLELLEEPPVIIFSTAYDQYALKAFEVNAVDYLLKPFSDERFADAIKKACFSLSNRKEYVENINKFIEKKDEVEEALNRIVVKKSSKILIIPVEKITHFEAQDDYVMIYSNEGKFLKQKTMKYFETHLDSNNFIRIHRSYILNVNFIKQIELYAKDSYKVILQDGTSLPVSIAGYQKLKEIMDK